MGSEKKVDSLAELIHRQRKSLGNIGKALTDLQNWYEPDKEDSPQENTAISSEDSPVNVKLVR